VEALRGDVRVVALTYPLVRSMDRLADGVAEAVRDLGRRPEVLWGNSFGGMVAQTVLRRHPDLAESVVLGRTAAPGAAAARRAALQRWLTDRLPKRVIALSTRAAMAKLLRELPAAERAAWMAYLEQDFLPEAKPRMAALAALAEDFSGQQWQPLREPSAVVVLLEAPGDRLYAKHGPELRRLYPTARVVELEGGHVSDADRSRTEARIVRGLLGVLQEDERAPNGA
jgi:pimeloyl-ACP methyl ester carboxylesterase